jgi:hypothetical protein
VKKKKEINDPNRSVLTPGGYRSNIGVEKVEPNEVVVKSKSGKYSVKKIKREDKV